MFTLAQMKNAYSTKIKQKAKKAVVKGLGSPLFPFSAVLVICNCKSCFGVTKVLNWRQNEIKM